MQTKHGVENDLPSSPSKKQRVADEVDVRWKEAGPLYIDLRAHKNAGSRGAEIKAFQPLPTGLCQAQVDGCQVGDVLIGLNQLTNAKEVEVMPFMEMIGRIKNAKWPLFEVAFSKKPHVSDERISVGWSRAAAQCTDLCRSWC
jgi:hypothetical protein